MSVLERCVEEIERRIRPATFPLAVKMLKKKENIPEGAKRPKKDFGYHLSLCQGFSLARRAGKTIAMLKEDMWCPEAIICYGLVEPPKYFLDGHMNKVYLKNLEAGKNYANSLPRFKPGKYVGVVLAPAMKANFEADVLVTYCNPYQIQRLISAMQYRDGRPITSEISGGACIRAVIPAIKTGRCQVLIPCGGDHRYGLSQDDEMIFAIPKQEMEDLTEGLRNRGNYIEKYGDLTLTPNHEMLESYMKTREILGLS